MTPEKFSEYQQKQLQALHDLTLKYVSSVQALTELHLQHTKDALEAHQQQPQDWLQVKDWQDLVALQSRSLQPLTERWTGYTQNIYDILLGLGHEMGRIFQHQPAPPEPPEQPDGAPELLAAPSAKTTAKATTGKKPPPIKPAA
jgi:phasin family protein